MGLWPVTNGLSEMTSPWECSMSSASWRGMPVGKGVIFVYWMRLPILLLAVRRSGRAQCLSETLWPGMGQKTCNSSDNDVYHSTVVGLKGAR